MTLSRYRILNLLLLLIIGSSSLAQKNIYQFSFPLQKTFRYAQEDPGVSAVTNEIILVIAEDIIRNPRRVSFTLNTGIRLRIDKTEGKSLVARISFVLPKLNGDKRYRKFPMAGVMMPGRLSFGWQIARKDSSSVFMMPETEGLKWQKNDSVLLYPLPQFRSDSDTVIFARLRFTYDQDDLSAFRERVSLINDYFAASAILDSLERKVSIIEPGRVDRYPVYFIILQELNKALCFIKEKDFSRRLELDSLDPARFSEKYARLSHFSHSATMTFRENLKTQDLRISGFSMDSLIGQYIDGMACYMRWSMLVTERSSPIYHEFLDRFFHFNSFGDDKEVIRNLSGAMFPGQDMDSILTMISVKINQAYHDRANDLMKNQQYAEAVEVLGNAAKFREMNPYLSKVPDHDMEIITRAANGIYNSFLGVADYAVMNGKPEMARTYMVRAQNYRKEHAAVVTADTLFNKVFVELVAESLSRCDTFYIQGQYSEALYCYQDFEKGFDSITLSSICHILEPKTQFCKYKILISQGLKNLDESDKPEAGRNFFLARQLSENEKFPADSLLDSLCTVTYPFYLMHLLRTGEYRIWMNQLTGARKFADSIAFLQRTTGVGSSRELSYALSAYRRKLETRSCWNAGEAVDILLLRSQHERELKQFLVAAALIDSAQLQIQQNPDCQIPGTGIQDSIRKYSKAVFFQNRMRNIDRMLINGQYPEAIRGYLEMENSYLSENIRRFGLDSIPMYDFIRQKNNTELTLAAYLYFQDKDRLEDALLYLKLLRLQEYPRRFAKPLQEWVGKELAGSDFRKDPDKKPFFMVRSHTGRDPWMKRFRFAYYSEARHLRGKPWFIYLYWKFFP